MRTTVIPQSRVLDTDGALRLAAVTVIPALLVIDVNIIVMQHVTVMETDDVALLGSVCVIHVIPVRTVGMNVLVMVVASEASANAIHASLEHTVILYAQDTARAVMRHASV